jgi:hypothetical protein
MHIEAPNVAIDAQVLEDEVHDHHSEPCEDRVLQRSPNCIRRHVVPWGGVSGVCIHSAEHKNGLLAGAAYGDA